MMETIKEASVDKLGAQVAHLGSGFFIAIHPVDQLKDWNQSVSGELIVNFALRLGLSSEKPDADHEELDDGLQFHCSALVRLSLMTHKFVSMSKRKRYTYGDLSANVGCLSVRFDVSLIV